MNLDYEYDIMLEIQSFRSQGLFCDFTIHVGYPKSTFKAHKLILAACSDYFKAMFISDTIESKNNEVYLKDLKASIFNTLLDFCYTSQLSLSEDIVQDLLLAATMLQIKEVQRLCSQYIIEKMDPSNCIGVMILAERCNLRELYNAAFRLCMQEFESISNNPEFLMIDEELLAEIISQDELNVESEENVFSAVIKWVSYQEGRRKFLSRLISEVRFTFIKPHKLVELETSELIQSSEDCKDLINKAKSHVILERLPGDSHGRPAKLMPTDGLILRPRETVKRQQRIYVIGGWSSLGQSSSKVECYDPISDEWYELRSMNKPRCGFGVASLNNYIYALGGHDGVVHLESVERLDINTGKWLNDVPDMSSAKAGICTVSSHGFLYVIGGQLGQQTLDVVERLDPTTNTWTLCKPLKIQRLGAGVTTLNGLIYVIGGGNATTTEVFSSVECYNPVTDEWSSVSPLISARKHLGCASYNGKIYVVGGKNENGPMSSGECYDPESDKWNAISDMSEKRYGIGFAALNGSLYAIGGDNGERRLSQVEAYNPSRDKWKMKSPMAYKRIGLGLAVHYYGSTYLCSCSEE